MMYIQCTVTKKLPSGVKTTSTFLPEKFAKLGKVLKLQDKNSEWEDGWVVESVGKDKYDSDYIRRQSREYLNHRKGTDI